MSTDGNKNGKNDRKKKERLYKEWQEACEETKPEAHKLLLESVCEEKLERIKRTYEKLAEKLRCPKVQKNLEKRINEKIEEKKKTRGQGIEHYLDFSEVANTALQEEALAESFLVMKAIVEPDDTDDGGGSSS